MGVTNPEQAEAGTIRKILANNIEENSIHGSDNIQRVQREISFFFGSYEIIE